MTNIGARLRRALARGGRRPQPTAPEAHEPHTTAGHTQQPTSGWAGPDPHTSKQILMDTAERVAEVRGHGGKQEAMRRKALKSLAAGHTVWVIDLKGRSA